MTAQVLTWILSEIRSEFRRLTGRSATTDLSDNDCDKFINDYYTRHFPVDTGVSEFEEFFTQALSAVDSGEYTLSQDVEGLVEPITINNQEILLYRDSQALFSDYPENEQYITAPTLAIGVSDVKKVGHSAFTYRINGYSYSKAASEITLSGDSIPAGKYGAFSFKINAAGTITVGAADDNATGYATPRLALEGLDAADSTSCYVGYLVVTKSDGAFVPGTTELSNSAVIDTYTDGQFNLRNTPEAAVLFDSKLYVRPKPNDIYQLKAISLSERPTALDSTSDNAPTDSKHGRMIAYGAAMLYLESTKDTEIIEKIKPAADYLLTSIRNDYYRRNKGRIVKASI